MAVGGVAVVAVLLRRRPRATTTVAVAILALTAFDLVTLNRDYHPQVTEAQGLPPAPAALRTARAIAGDGRVMGVGPDVLPQPRRALRRRDPRAARPPRP